MTINWNFLLVGFIVGTCMAYSGVGAGAITTPLLIFLGVRTDTAIGSDLLFALGTKIVAMFTHMQKRTVSGRYFGGSVSAVCPARSSA